MWYVPRNIHNTVLFSLKGMVKSAIHHSVYTALIVFVNSSDTYGGSLGGIIDSIKVQTPGAVVPITPTN